MGLRKFKVFTVVGCASFLFAGCIKSFHEKRLGEELWEVGYTDIALCDKAAPEPQCIEQFKPQIIQRGSELCGARLQAELGPCEKTQRKGLYAVVCQVSCAERKTAQRVIPIRIASGEESSYEQSTRQLRAIFNSKKLSSLFGGTGVGVIMRLDKESFVLANDSHQLCIKAVTASGSNEEILLKSAEQVSCKLFGIEQ